MTRLPFDLLHGGTRGVGNQGADVLHLLTLVRCACRGMLYKVGSSMSRIGKSGLV